MRQSSSYKRLRNISSGAMTHSESSRGVRRQPELPRNFELGRARGRRVYARLAARRREGCGATSVVASPTSAVASEGKLTTLEAGAGRSSSPAARESAARRAPSYTGRLSVGNLTHLHLGGGFAAAKPRIRTMVVGSNAMFSSCQGLCDPRCAASRPSHSRSLSQESLCNAVFFDMMTPPSCANLFSKLG